MKKIIVAIGFVFFSAVLFAQEEEKTKERGFRKEKLFTGGSFGLSFGDYTFINLSPQLGYRFNRYLASGFGINGQYVSQKRYNFSGETFRMSNGVAGLNVFGRVYPIQNIMLQVQPELNYVWGRMEYANGLTTKSDAEIIPSMLVGGGVVLPSGEKSALIAGLFYDVLQRENAPYGRKPFINFTYNFGL